VLTEAYPQAITSKDKRQRTPLHFALSNAGRRTVPSAVRLLLSLNPQIVNSIDNGPLPLRVLAEYSHTIKNEDEKKEDKQESVFRCLEHIFNAEPDPTANFLTALQSLPDWLQERAVVMPVVQILLNDRSAFRPPSSCWTLSFLDWSLCLTV
jgi:ankyrin repeat protein